MKILTTGEDYQDTKRGFVDNSTDNLIKPLNIFDNERIEVELQDLIKLKKQKMKEPIYQKNSGMHQ